MAKYLILIRKQPAQVKGKGADKGDVISMRLASAGTTKFERERCDVVEKEMTEAQVKRMQKKVRPRTNYVPLTQPPDMEKNPDVYKAWELACQEEQSKLKNWGLKVDFDAVPEIKAKLKDIDDFGKVVEPIMVDKAVIGGM